MERVYWWGLRLELRKYLLSLLGSNGGMTFGFETNENDFPFPPSKRITSPIDLAHEMRLGESAKQWRMRVHVRVRVATGTPEHSAPPKSAFARTS